MEIKNNKISEELSPKEYIIVENIGLTTYYTLNYLIDRSEKGKSPDIGMPRIFLLEEEVRELIKNGFSVFVKNIPN